jgi:glycosyltransferase involved in cell wall biosynthesis
MADAPRPILLLVDRISNSDQARTIRAFVDRLAGRGIAAKILCTSWGDPSQRGVVVEEWPGLADRWRLAWTLHGLRPDLGPDRPVLLHVLHARMAAAGLEVAERWRLPYLQGIEEFLLPGARLRLSRRWCRGLVATSRELAVDLIRNLQVPEEWVKVVHRGIKAAEPGLARRDEGSERIPVIGTAGPLTPGSGFATFLNAARRVIDAGKDAEFVVVGEGEEEGELRRRADRLRIAERVTFADDDAVGLSFWDVLDIYCQPATVPTVGRSLAHAMAHGLPVIASDIEGLRVIVEHDQTGIRVSPGDSEGLARAILDLLNDRPRGHRLGLRGREAVMSDYDLDREVTSLAELYHAIIDDEPEASQGESAAS